VAKKSLADRAVDAAGLDISEAAAGVLLVRLFGNWKLKAGEPRQSKEGKDERTAAKIFVVRSGRTFWHSLGGSAGGTSPETPDAHSAGACRFGAEWTSQAE